MSASETEPMRKKKMRAKIIELERENLNTKKYTEKEMVDRVRKIIELEVESRY